MQKTQAQSVEVEVSQQHTVDADFTTKVDFKDIQERIQQHRDVFVLVGLAGSGKSTVADIIAEEHDEEVETYEVSDFIRTKFNEGHDDAVNFIHTKFNEEHDDAVNDNELGEWAAEQKDKYGNDYFVREMAEDIKDPSTPHVVISGVRSPEEAVAVEDVFGDCTSSPSQDGDSIVASSDATTTVGIWTLPDIRFERKYGGTPSVEHEDWETFKERNERELWEWGAVEFFARESLHTADYIIPNNDDLEGLRTCVQHLLSGEGQYDVNPFPHDDCETVAQYL